MLFQGEDAVSADRTIEQDFPAGGEGVAGLFLVGDGECAGFEDDLPGAPAAAKVGKASETRQGVFESKSD